MEDNSANSSNVNDRYMSDALLFQRFAPQALLIERVYFPLWTTLGIPGGFFSFLVWSGRSMRRGGCASAAIFQATLGLLDMGYLTVNLVVQLQLNYRMNVLDYPVICELIAVFLYLLQYLSPTLTLAFTLERFLAIRYPFRSQHCLVRASERGALKTIVIIAACCLCTALPQSFFFTYADGTCNTRPEINNNTLVTYKLYRGWVFTTEILYFFCLPVTCLLLNLVVINVLRQNIRHKKSITPMARFNGNNGTTDRMEQTEKIGRASTMTLLITSLYIVCAQFASTVAILIYNTIAKGDANLTDAEIENDPTWKRYFALFTARTTFEGFNISHFAAKLPIYMITSKHFRQEFLRLICQCKRRQTESPFVDFSAEKSTSLRSNPSLSGRNGRRSTNLVIWRNLSSRLINHGRKASANEEQNSVNLPTRKRMSAGLSRTVISVTGERISLTAKQSESQRTAGC